MKNEAIICIPGPWADRSDFLRALMVAEPAGSFIFAGLVLSSVLDHDHVTLEFCDVFPGMSEAFRRAGQGRLSPPVLAAIQAHRSVAYLHFPLDWLGQRERLVKFTGALQRAGGLAVKVESSGVAHEWERWFALLQGNAFDAYCSAVTLVGAAARYYSCGMHHFGLPECSVPHSVEIGEAADLMNRFNMYQIDEQPAFASGQTFSTAPDAPCYRLQWVADSRHDVSDPFHNPHGIWQLSPR